MKKSRILAVMLALLLLLAGCAQAVEKPAAQTGYEEAVLLLQAGSVKEAADKFSALGHYADAGEYAMYCRALLSADAQNFELAAATMNALGDFMDSRLLAVYYTARAYESVGMYEMAAEAYAKVPQYMDVMTRAAALPEKILQRDYAAAETLEKTGRLAEAESAFLALGDYKDSRIRASALREQLNEQAYLRAAELEEKDDIKGAYDAFVALGNYKDSPARAKVLMQEADYRHAFELAESGSYQQALSLYRELGDYRDAQERARLLSIIGLADRMERLGKGVYSFRIDDEWGFIDLNTHRDLSPSWTSISAFNASGLAYVAQNGKYGLINSKGETVLPCTYSQIMAGEQGGFLAVTTVSTGRYTSSSTCSLLSSEGTVLSSKWVMLNQDPYTGLPIFSGGFTALRKEDRGGGASSARRT